MILRQYRSLGLLPEIVVFAFILCSLLSFGYAAVRISWRDPVITVPNAIGAGALHPATADEAYIRAFAASFLGNWTTWNEYTYQYRKSIAISMMTASVRPQFRAMASKASNLVASLSQSQSYLPTSLEVSPGDVGGSYFIVRYLGELHTFYGGVGGGSDPYTGRLLLRAVHPTSNSPLCLEVYGFLTDRPPEPLKP